jgi:RHS repeat-associated protein
LNGDITHFEYNANGNRTEVRVPNGAMQLYTFDNINRLTELKTLDNLGNVVALYQYTLGNMGERLTINENGRIVRYEYDELLRLTKETTITGGTTTTTSFTHDAIGNRLTKNENGAVTTYTYNALNQLLTERGAININYTYDKNGNLTEKAAGNGETTRFTWDAEGRLIRATIQNGQDVHIESYTYDAFFNRITKSDEIGVTTRYLVDMNNWITLVLAELNADSTLKTYHTWAGDTLISLHRENETRYYMYDGHGSVRMLMDENANITDTYTFDAFGNLTDRTGETENDFLYAGEQFNSATGMYFLRDRYMDPSTGRFISQDRWQGLLDDPITMNRYLYANANPVMFTDPTGFYSMTDVMTSITIQAVLYSSVMTYISINTFIEVSDFATKINKALTAYLSTLDFTTTSVAVANDIKSQVIYQLAADIIAIVSSLIDTPYRGRRGNYSVYVVRDQKDPTVIIYVGITSQPIQVREKQHRRRIAREEWRLIPVASGLTRVEARTLEQFLISSYTLEHFHKYDGNQIRSIGSGRVNDSEFADAISSAQH